jgi:hypothetical protein
MQLIEIGNIDYNQSYLRPVQDKSQLQTISLTLIYSQRLYFIYYIALHEVILRRRLMLTTKIVSVVEMTLFDVLNSSFTEINL